MRNAGVQIKILCGQSVAARIALKLKRRRAAAGPVAGHGLSAGGCFPGGDADGCVAVKLHGFGFDAAGMVSDAAFFVSDAGGPLEPLADGIAPDDGMACLIGEPLEDFGVALLIHAAFECLPLLDEMGCIFGALVMGVKDVLDDGLARMQL